MINVEPCRGCGRILFTSDLGGITLRVDSDPVNAQEAVDALTQHGATLYRLQSMGGKPHALVSASLGDLSTLAGPAKGRAYVVRPHRCTAAGPLTRTTPVQDGGQGPKGPEAGTRSRASLSTQSTERPTSSAAEAAPGAESPRSSARRHPRAPRCDRCSKPCSDGTYAAIELGALTVWAEHITDEMCETER